MLFSIIIPVYNAQNSIIRCLDRLIRQTTNDYEVILINDGSKDHSEGIIRDFILKNNCISFKLFNQSNAGAGAARNAGIKLAKGDYLVFLDSDDYVENDYLERISETIKEEGSDIIFINLVRERENGTIIRKEDMSQFSGLNKDRLIRNQLTGKVPWGGVRKVVRASIVKYNKIEYSSIKVGEESIFSFRILELAKNISFQPKAVYHYVESNDSLTAQDNISNSEQVFNFMYSYLKEHEKYDKYQTTIRAMAVTSTAVSLNVICKSGFSLKTWKQMRSIIAKYRPYYSGKVDKKALDSRVKLCYPWISLNMVLPIVFMSKIQSLKNKIMS